MFSAACLVVESGETAKIAINVSGEYFCYILECADGSYYTGWTTDLQRRIRQHNSGRGARYTAAHRPVRLVYVEEQPDRSTAMKREAKIKTFSHTGKQRLIQKFTASNSRADQAKDSDSSIQKECPNPC